jgi:hypothetical protein
MNLVRLDNSAIRATAVFRDPLLSWTAEVPLRFFRAMYGALSNVLHIQLSDFAATPGTTLADCSASLRVFGSNTTLTLRPNALVADFPVIAAAQLQFANSLILQGYEATRSEFSELQIASITSNAAHYFKIADDAQVYDVLGFDSEAEWQKRGKAHTDIVVERGLRFKLVDKQGRWNSRVTIEKSEIATSDIFLHRELHISDVSGLDTARQIFELVSDVDNKILQFLRMKVEAV